MTSIDKLIASWVASWNERDPAKREAVIETSWSPDGVYRNVTNEFEGYDGIARAVTAAYDAFVANGFVFTVAKVDANHDAVRYQWEMRPADGGEPDSIGTHIAVVGADGRFISDHQFIDLAPSAS
jgi:nuclear transport factor 2 (NTF2) superfamily protein